MIHARRATFLVAGISLFYWIAFGGTSAGALFWRHQFICQLGLFLIFLFAGWRALRLQLPLRRLPIWLDAALGLIILDKLWRAIAGQSWNSTEDLSTSGSLLILFYVLLQLVEPTVLGASCVFATALACLVGLALAFFRHQELALPLGSRVLMAGLLIAVAPMALEGARRRDDDWRHKTFWIASSAVLLVGIVQTRSLAALAIVPAILIWFATMAVKSRQKRIVSGVVLAAAIVCAFWLGNYRGSLSRLGSLVNRGEDSSMSLENRFRYWSGAIPAIEQKKLLGWGSESVGLIYPLFRIQRPGFSPPGEVIPDLHSVPMNWLFEFGAIGLVIRMAAFAALLAIGLSRKTPLQKAAVAGLAAYALFSLMHYNLSNPATYLVLTLVAVVAATPGEPTELSLRSSHVVGLLTIAGAAIIFSYQLRLDYANRLLSRATSEPERAAVGSLIRSSLLDPRAGFYDAMAALQIDRILRGIGKNETDVPFLLKAADGHYVHFLERNPWEMQIAAARGNLLLRNGRSCDAIEPLERAASLDFYFSISHFNLANAYSLCDPGMHDAAVEEAAISLMTTPPTAFASQWRTHPALLEAALDQSLRWLDSWNWRSGGLQTEKLNRLRDFLRGVRANPLQGRRQVTFALVEKVSGDLITDPFAYILQRKTPPYEFTRIELDGLDTGTWTPEGIGRIKGLRSLTFAEVRSAYQTGKLDRLMRSVLAQ